MQTRNINIDSRKDDNRISSVKLCLLIWRG
ncbi:MAG: hypothetical protein [Wendovervirus sonii]|uniref:Uncharacterized protein n=1 Tax=phage Lak_Megaphage_Sonny TaxID=3109229 RepID=A0ABZ0Z3S9_9CAUD|nr:MAG: hypothetical protein [phage Lak_Megaphage_Sonny]